MINISGGLILAMACALAAVWVWFEPPGRRLQRLDQSGHRYWAGIATPHWLQARPDAWSRRRRVIIAVVVGGSASWMIIDQGGVWRGAGLAVAPVLTLAGFVLLGKLEPASVAAERRRMILELPQAYELLGVCLGAGLPLTGATAQVAGVMDGPVGQQLDRVLTAIKLGVTEGEAWRLLSDHPQLGRAAVDLARSADTGTMMIETLRHHAEQARRQRQAELEARAKTVGVSSVLPLMVCFLPAFFLIGIVPTVVSAMQAALS